MIKIQFGVSKRYHEKIVERASAIGYDVGYEHGQEDGAETVLRSIRHRISLLNEDFPVSVEELRNWVGMTRSTD